MAAACDSGAVGRYCLCGCRHDGRSRTIELRFTPDYRERVCLRDDTEVLLRLVIPADKLLLKRGMDRSRRSRVTNASSAPSTTSRPTSYYLTDLDGADHFALGALATNDAGRLDALLAAPASSATDA